MVPLNVPMQDSRLILRSFWLIISFVFASTVSLAGWAFHLPFPWTAGAVLFLLVASLVLVREKLVRRLYHAWNNRIVTPLSNFASALVLRICLLVVFTATGRAGSRLRLRGVAGSMWQPHDSGPSNGRAQTQSSRPRGWIRNYLQWAIRSRNGWAVFLIPFFCLLRMVSTEEERAAAGNIYTLF
jgi:hypothetical protein